MLFHCCLDDGKWRICVVYSNAREARGRQELTPFGLRTLLAVHHGEHVQVGDLGYVRGIAGRHHEVKHQQPWRQTCPFRVMQLSICVVQKSPDRRFQDLLTFGNESL